MKLLVFAHTPPPHHGQSYMVEQMLKGFGGDWRRRETRRRGASPYGIECYHVNARLSKNLEDIGSFRPLKFLHLAWFCLQAILIRYRHGVTNFYYVPAPGKHSALYRDWLVMWLCRRYFKRIILHWHAAGLGRWLETAVQLRTRATTYALLGGVDQSIVLSRYNCCDAEKLWPAHIRVVGNGIPDPCPDFEEVVLPRRAARFEARKKLMAGGSLATGENAAAGDRPEVFKVLFLAHCIREKGLFDALEGVALAAKKLVADGSAIRLHFTVAGEFMIPAEEADFNARIRKPDLESPDGMPLVDYVGFVSGEGKREVFLNADCFCFPTYYYAESFGLVVVEAMAFGLPVVTTRWRSLPEMFPDNYNGLVDVHSPGQVAAALVRLTTEDCSAQLRQRFLDRYLLSRHLENLANAIRSPGEGKSLE